MRILGILIAVGCRAAPADSDPGPADSDEGPACTLEVCNGRDDDCDGAVDEGASDARAWHVDADGDGHGTLATLLACDQPVGASATCRWRGDAGLADAAAAGIAPSLST